MTLHDTQPIWYQGNFARQEQLEVQMGNQDSYVHNFARTLAGQLGLKAWDYRYLLSAQVIAAVLVATCWPLIHRTLYGESASTIGRLACAGVGSGSDAPENRVKMEEVHHNATGLPWLQLHWSGADIVRHVATTSVVAAMANNLWQENELQRKMMADFMHTSRNLSETVDDKKYWPTKNP